VALTPQARKALEGRGDEIPPYAEGYDLAAAREAARRAAAEEPREDVAEVRDVDADGVRCRLYRPALPGGSSNGNADGVVVHLHGGGFVFHDIDVHDPAARRLANSTGLAVLSVDYRRPPEHRFPAAPDDVDTALAWLDRTRDELGLGGPTFVHGDSAGGNLALVAALRNPGRFAAAVLIYPFLDPTASFDSYRTAADGHDPREGAWYWQQYAASSADLSHPDLAPLGSDRLDSLPPTLVITAEHDVLRDEGEHLAAQLAELDVDVTATRYLGQLHNFWLRPDVFPQARAAVAQVAAFLRLHV
jgi:acetyl esterase